MSLTIRDTCSQVATRSTTWRASLTPFISAVRMYTDLIELDLLKVKSSCSYHKNHKNRAIVIEICDSNLRELYKGNYIFQVWDEGKKKYEKVLNCKIIHYFNSYLRSTIVLQRFLWSCHLKAQSSWGRRLAVHTRAIFPYRGWQSVSDSQGGRLFPRSLL
jgi:hypothetical protein